MTTIAVEVAIKLFDFFLFVIDVFILSLPKVVYLPLSGSFLGHRLF